MTTKKTMVAGLILASSMLATPALARDDSWYIEGDAGGTLMEDMKYLLTTNTGVLNTKPGFDVGVVAGYDFGGFRLEGEVSYRRAKADGFSSGPANFSGSSLTGHASALSFMVNGLLDFGADDPA